MYTWTWNIHAYVSMHGKERREREKKPKQQQRLKRRKKLLCTEKSANEEKQSNSQHLPIVRIVRVAECRVVVYVRLCVQCNAIVGQCRMPYIQNCMRMRKNQWQSLLLLLLIRLRWYVMARASVGPSHNCQTVDASDVNNLSMS